MWYDASDAASNTSIMRAAGSSLASLTKDGAGARISPSANANSNLTANLTGRIATVSDTMGFVADAVVLIDQDTTFDNFGVSRIRKVTDATHLELYHGLDGFTTATPAKVLQADASKTLGINALVLAGATWFMYRTIWEPFQQIGGSYGALFERPFLYQNAQASPSNGSFSMQQLPSSVYSGGFNNDQRSSENMTLLMTPVLRGRLFLPFVAH